MRNLWNRFYNRLLLKVITWLGLGSSTFVFMACYAPAPEDYHLIVFPSSIELPAEDGATEFFTISTEGDWTITRIPSFTYVSVKNGHGTTSVSVRAKGNKDPVERKDIIVVEGDDNSETVSVVQHGGYAKN